MDDTKRKYPKNVIVSDVPYRDEEDESLKDLYEDLDLQNLVMISIDARKDNYKKDIPKYPPYGGAITALTGLNKEMTLLELKEKVSVALKWPVDEIRLWEKSQYEEYIEGNYDNYNSSPYRDFVPEFIGMEENEVMFPLFLSDQYIIAERVSPSLPSIPSSPKPEAFSQSQWWLSLFDDWKGQTPTVNNSIYQTVEVVRMGRGSRNNSLFAALGYLFHILSDVKGENGLDEAKDGITQASRHRAAKVRKSIARFVADRWEAVEESKVLGSLSPEAYFRILLDPSYSGGDIELTLAAILHGALIQVYDIPTQKMLQYGRGHVERFGNPERPGPRFAVKLARWENGFYDPIGFSLQPGMDPDRHENRFCMAYALQTFKWMKSLPKRASSPEFACSNCSKAFPVEKLSICADCHLVYYCTRRCQILHWKGGHKGVCQKVDVAGEREAEASEEEKAYCALMPELLRRREKKEGVRRLRAMAESGFEGMEKTGDGEEVPTGEAEVGKKEVFEEVEGGDIEGLFVDEDTNVTVSHGKVVGKES